MIKGLIIVLSSVLAAFAAPVLNDELDQHWELYKSRHSKVYTSEQEEMVRRLIWEDHVDYIAQHNREYDLGLHTFTVGLNEYADMSNQEFVATMNGYLYNASKISDIIYMEPSNVEIPDSVDWRKQGYVTEVKNQGQCGSCWAFSTTGSLEGQHFKATKKLVSLSEQNLVDCSGGEGNMGCEGGLMDQAFTYIKKNNGIDTEESYPYKARDGKCHFKKEDVGATVKGYVDVKHEDEDALKSAVATVGPISVAIDASHVSFQLYSNGVYNERDCSPTELDHGVLAVGYGTSDDGKDYWIVKNSWGKSWGQDGYIWMSRNKDNQCGIASQASYPMV